MISPFSTDMASLSSAIDELEYYNDTRGVARGLRTAEELIDGVTNPDAVKNVVLFTTGLTNIGEYDYDGIYDENTKASEWRNNKTQVRLYAYANAACAVAESLKEKATLYSVGIFKTMEDISLEGQELVDFFKLFASDLATSKGHFYELLDPNELEFAFGEVAEDITKLNDADGDGLPDIWETQGADTDGDGIIDLPLKLMGADPNVPDIFVEIDWMVQPEIKVGPLILRKETNLAPSKTAMRMVYESFRKEGINLHIDAGPDSVDYVTGNKWGDLSGGNEIPYNKHFDLGSGYVNWNLTTENNFSSARERIFKHCMFIYQIQNFTISGKSNDIPGQYFIIANQEWLRNLGDIAVAGTFMHELGHTLGLGHGGVKEDGTQDEEMYKPNYLSIMNYLFQTTGLAGINALDYSQHKLPDLDESALSETAGIDPFGLTEGTNFGTKLRIAGNNAATVLNIAGVPIDFNQDGTISEEISFDVNKDGNDDILKGCKDWDKLTYTGGNVGYTGNTIHVSGVGAPDPELEEALTELSLETALENGVLADEGTGALEALGPYTLITGDLEQSAYVRITNMAGTAGRFTLHVDESEINAAIDKEIDMDASVDELSYVDIPVPIKNAAQDGEYSIHATLSYGNEIVSELEIPVELHTVSADDIRVLGELIHSESEEISEAEIPDAVMDEYASLYEQVTDEGNNTEDPDSNVDKPGSDVEDSDDNVDNPDKDTGNQGNTSGTDTKSADQKKAVETGDRSSLAAVLLVLVMSGCCCGILLYQNYKRKRADRKR